MFLEIKEEIIIVKKVINENVNINAIAFETVLATKTTGAITSPLTRIVFFL